MDPLLLLFIGIAVVVGGILALRLHAFLALIAAALIVGGLTPASNIEQHALDKKMTPAAAKKLAGQSVGERVANEFGGTAGKIGILIAMAAIIGKCLLESGAADRIVRSALKAVGERGAPAAFVGTGFLLATPVFFDTVFYLLIPLGKALGMRSPRNYGLYVMTIIAGATMAHSLVPPTPGPLLVAERLNIDIGTMIIGGAVLGLFTSGTGYLYALWANRKWQIPLRESGDVSLADLKALAERDDKNLPPLWMSLFPIFLPVVLIAGNTVLKSMLAGAASVEPWQKSLQSVMGSLGDPNIALTISAAIALAMLAWQKRESLKELMGGMQAALASGGLIILITAAGGAFGGILQQTNIGPRIQELSLNYQIGVLPLVFFVTALVRTAQGSATVAMITAVGILSSVADPAYLGFHPVYVALAIGCGSKPFPWMNDSGFWVINKLSGMTIGETIKTFSFMLTAMALVGLLILMILARVLPMV